MDKLVGWLASAYLGIAAVVIGAGFYGVYNKNPTRDMTCAEVELAITSGTAPAGSVGQPNNIQILGLRGLTWPVAGWSAAQSGLSLMDWLLLKYDYAPDACKLGGGAQG
jgi:hypothetical protein